MRGNCGIFWIVALCSAAALALPGVAAADFRGPAYQDTSGAPTTSKPESKLWFHDGFWWASMHNGRQGNKGGAYTIHRLNRRTQRWADTGVVIDRRDSTRQDALRIGNRLFVASHKYKRRPVFDSTPGGGDGMVLYRFFYNNGQNRYVYAGGRAIDAQRTEALTIDRDSAGRIWATWVQEDPTLAGTYNVYVKGTNTGCAGGTIDRCTFQGATILDRVGADDISAIIRFGGNIGVMWSDTPATQMSFLVNPGGGWGGVVETAANGDKLAEDHINLKAAGNTVYAAVKTKFSRRATKPGIRLLVRPSNGVWRARDVWDASFRYTRPLVLLEGRRVRVFAGPRGGDVFMKTAGRSSLRFSGGRGTRVLAAADPTSTKQNLSGSTQMIVVGSDHQARRYRHSYTQLASCINGNRRRNRIVGTAANDRLCGRGGNDRLYGLGGNDVLKGGGGKDKLVGGGGHDSLRGGSRNDKLIARDRVRDVVKGGPGRDRARVDGVDVRRSIERLI